MPVASTPVTIAPSWTSTPRLRSFCGGLGPEVVAERTQHRRCCVEQHDAGPRRVDRAEVAAQRAPGQLGDLASHLHPGRSRPDDDERHEALDLLGGAGQLGPLEGAEDATAQLERVVDRLHAGGVPREVVVAEVRLARTGGDEQRVVLDDGLAVQDPGGDRPGGEVDVGDVAEQNPGVVLPGQHLTGGRGDLALGEDACGHLVEQGLEQVVRGLGDQRDVDIGVLERLGAEQPTEPRADHDDAVALLGVDLVRHTNTLL